jgi:hypothetical protein
VWWIVVIVILALILGGVGLIAKALWWLLIIAGVLFLLGAFGFFGRRGRRCPAPTLGAGACTDDPGTSWGRPPG